MTAMIQNDEEKAWMMPLLTLRNELDCRGDASNRDEGSDHHLRDFRRMTGAIQLMQNGRPVPGPYTQESRAHWLRKLLEAQAWIRRNGPPQVQKIELISLDELQEIRRIWVVDKHELEDSLPSIYTGATGEPYPGCRLDDNLVLGAEAMAELHSLCGDDRLHYELTRELLSIERQQRAHARRSGLFDRLEKSISRHFYDDREDAVELARQRAGTRERNRESRVTNEVPQPGEPTDPQLDLLPSPRP
jgi:DNA sulfur modification protein DndC